MPYRSKHHCRSVNCPTLVDRPGYCTKHEKLAVVADTLRRGTAHERGYSSAWRKSSKSYLLRHPLCRSCEAAGLVVAAVLVDHIIPPRWKAAQDSGDPIDIERASALFWDSEGNWQPLCKRCHDRKTNEEDGGAFKRRIT